MYYYKLQKEYKLSFDMKKYLLLGSILFIFVKKVTFKTDSFSDSESATVLYNIFMR